MGGDEEENGQHGDEDEVIEVQPQERESGHEVTAHKLQSKVRDFELELELKWTNNDGSEGSKWYWEREAEERHPEAVYKYWSAYGSRRRYFEDIIFRLDKVVEETTFYKLKHVGQTLEDNYLWLQGQETPADVVQEWERKKRERSENLRERRISRNGRTGVIEDSDEEGGR